MSPSSLLSLLALGVAGAALVLSLRTPAAAPAPVAPAAPAACECAPDPQVERRIAALQARVVRAERRAEAVERQTAEVAEQAAKTEPKPEPARYEHFEVPHAGVTVSQSEGGALAVRNTDPALTGRIIEVQATDQRGAEVPLTLTIPPPE